MLEVVVAKEELRKVTLHPHLEVEGLDLLRETRPGHCKDCGVLERRSGGPFDELRRGTVGEMAGEGRALVKEFES